MERDRNLLCFGLLILLGLLAIGRAARPPPRLGSTLPPERCRLVEEAGVGVRCARATERALRAGDRLAPAGSPEAGRVLGRMAPARLAALAIAVDVNRASMEELASLEEIGPALARRIAAARPFHSLDEVARVTGVGRARLERLRGRLALDE
jgi:DNA uptake protein ComE-like DNA-binding protein